MWSHTIMAATNDPAAAAVPTQPALGSPRRRPQHKVDDETEQREPDYGVSGIDHGASALQRTDVIGGGPAPPPVNGHDYAEADNNLGGRHHQYEKDGVLAADVVQHPRERLRRSG